MDKQGIDHVDRIGLAGAFGTFIDPMYAMVLGLIPDCPLDKVKAVGNAAGTGARMALLNRDYRREIEETVSKIEKIETALESKFQEHFVSGCGWGRWWAAPNPRCAGAHLHLQSAKTQGEARRNFVSYVLACLTVFCYG